MRQLMIIASLFVVLVLNAPRASGQTITFTHHGNLGFSVTTTYDLRFTLYDSPTSGSGTQQGVPFDAPGVAVTNGEFTATGISFGATVFTGGELFLETAWSVPGSGTFTVVSPREKVTAVYANRSLSAATADNATQLGGQPASGFIQNTTSQQPGDFNVAGNGTAGGTLSATTVSATTQFNLGAGRFLGGSGSETYVGFLTGNAVTSGYSNTFVGGYAGSGTTTGHENSFFGNQAGLSNTGGLSNSFFGAYAGRGNFTGSYNAFFGNYAGYSNNTGQYNAFFGMSAGNAVTNGSYNAFFGSGAGQSTTTAGANSFFGAGAGMQNIGQSNTFIGYSAGSTNTTGSNNTLIGTGANVATANLTNAAAIGTNAQVGQSNSLVLGSINGVNFANADTKVGIGTTTPSFRLHIIDPSNQGLRVQTNAAGGQLASFGGNGDFQIDAPGIVGGRFAVTEGGFTGIGIAAPEAKLHVRTNNGNIFIGDAGCGAGFGGIGFGSSMVACVNYSLLGDGTNTFINRPANGSIFFRMGNSTQMMINSSGAVSINTLGAAGFTQLCRNSSNQISSCSSSLRYKENIAPFRAGLSLVNRLRPITFNWKSNGEADLGLGAEDVAKIEPLLVTHNERGEVEGVKYDRVTVILLNAVKEQQAQIKQQTELIKEQQARLEGLKRLVCKTRPHAKACN